VTVTHTKKWIPTEAKDNRNTYREMFEKGSRWIDENLFNGEYYEHKITNPETFEYLDMNNSEVNIPAFQLGRGCLVNQLVGQYMAHICRLGYLGKKENIWTTLHSIQLMDGRMKKRLKLNIINLLKI
jgi:uncharacterized protein (DUF608 family)